MRSLGARLLAVIATLASLASCSSEQPDCSCVVEASTERRTLACGTTACIDGNRVSCTDQDEIADRGACSVAATPGADDEPVVAEPAMPPDTSCADLYGYCGANCSAPATVSADCLVTAAAGDADACRQWPLASGVLCRP